MFNKELEERLDHFMDKHNKLQERYDLLLEYLDVEYRVTEGGNAPSVSNDGFTLYFHNGVKKEYVKRVAAKGAKNERP